LAKPSIESYYAKNATREKAGETDVELVGSVRENLDPELVLESVAPGIVRSLRPVEVTGKYVISL